MSIKPLKLKSSEAGIWFIYLIIHKVIEAHRAGIRNKDIAEKFNTSKSNVTKILKTYGECI